MPTTQRGVPGNVPYELPNFVGRRQELKELRSLLATSRLVTLTGVGGVGKTRLALRVTAEARRAFRDGTWLVDLTEVRDPNLLAQEVQDPDTVAHLVMAVLGVRQGAGSPVRRLTEYLTHRQTLLVLDNCEHLLPACALMIDAPLRACPRLRVLATSREPLALRGEVLYPVAPLSAPDPAWRPSVADLTRYDSVALFLTGAQAAVPAFTPHRGQRHRGGRAVPPARRAAVGDRAGRRLGQDTRTTADPGPAGRPVRPAVPRQPRRPPRQQALRACVEWSFNLCSKPERLLWARSSVFVGGFELDAVEGVCATGDGEKARYRMLETDRLVIAQRTAESHVEHIRDKLGFTNRTQIAAWVAEQPPPA